MSVRLSGVIDTLRKCIQGALIRHKFRNCASRQCEIMTSILLYKVVVAFPFREHVAEWIYTDVVKAVAFCNLKCVLKSYTGQKKVVSSMDMSEMIDAIECKKTITNKQNDKNDS